MEEAMREIKEAVAENAAEKNVNSEALVEKEIER